MKLWDLHTNRDYCFRGCKCHLLGNGNPRGKQGFVKLTEGTLTFFSGHDSYMFTMDFFDKDLVLDLLKRGFKTLCSVSGYIDPSDLQTFLMDITFFSLSKRLGDMNIYLTKRVTETLISHRIAGSNEVNTKDFLEEFADTFMLNDGNLQCVAFTDGMYHIPETNIESEMKEENEPDSIVPEDEISEDEVSEDEVSEEHFPEEDEAAEEKKVEKKPTKVPEKEQRAIAIYGKNCTLYLRNVNNYLVAEKAVFNQRNNCCMKLGYCTITFNSEENLTSETVKMILKESPGYINLWNNYANMEGEFLLRKARRVGLLYYTGVPYFSNGTVKLYFDKKAWGKDSPLKFLNKTDQVNLGWVPPYLNNEKMTWAEYIKLPGKIRHGNVTYSDLDFQSAAKNENGMHGYFDKLPQYQHSAEIAACDEYSITLKWKGQGKPPENPISLSIIGSENQIERRSSARFRIENGICANPRMALLIEGITEDSITSTPKLGNLPPISDYVMRKVFPKNKPTENQMAAISLALNTPDIAIIQGPPGTGKTTVIKAIIERLNETGRKKTYEPGTILVTSMQHDAVYNVIKELEINGMVTIKFGSRSHADDSIEEWDRDATEWCRKVSAAILEKNPQLRSVMGMTDLKSRYRSYRSCPDDEKAKDLLEFCLTLPISAEHKEQVRDILVSFGGSGEWDGNIKQDSDLVVAVRRLRVRSEGFEDDGVANAMALYIMLERLAEQGKFNRDDSENSEILSVLKRAAKAQMADKALLKDTARIRNILLSRLLPPPFYSLPTVREDIVELVSEITDSLTQSSDKRDMVLRELVHELENNPEAAKATVQSYNYVFAATAQQSMGKDVLSAKHADPKKNMYPQYDTVIVDEAARVAPTDLMIPMSQAARRIILVGDHRQLPHIYDEEIFEEMQSNDQIEDESNIAKSMFEYLINSARRLEESDGIRRVITLENQYRTHPMLGQFVSENFYPSEEQFNSPLGAENFCQPISDSPIIWADIPADRGMETRENSSRLRKVEVDYIAKQLRIFLESEKCKELKKFGVITFYRAQVAELRKALGDLADDPRVTIGTVDSFQGLEFDVVFLSVVRTAAKEVDPDDLEVLKESDEVSFEIRNKIGMKYYGFLVSENRLCVALSRQVKLLIVVGDKDVFTKDKYGTLAGYCVPAMKNLYNLAKTEGKIMTEGEIINV